MNTVHHSAESLPAGGVDPDCLTVMSFNVRVDSWLDLGWRWRRRGPAVAEVIRSARPDLAGLQEARKHQIDDLAQRLDGYAWTGAGRADGKQKGEFVPIFYRTDRLELLSGATFWLSPTPDRPGSRGWGTWWRRIVTWAELRDRRTGGELLHFNTHFEPFLARAKREEAKLLLRRVRSIAAGRATLVTGDINGTPRSAHYRILTAGDVGRGPQPELALKDAKGLSRCGHAGSAGTMRGMGAARRAARRLDYIFVAGGVSVLEHATLTCDRAAGRPSDHLPVLARVKLAGHARPAGPQ